MRKRYPQRLDAFTILKNRPVAVEVVADRLDKPIFDKRTTTKLTKLKKIYRRVPKTDCLKCGECCYRYKVDSVYSIEYLNILRHIKEKFVPVEISKFYAFAKMNLGMEQKYRSRNTKRLKKWRPCIFIDEQKKICKIYGYRPLVCRIYALNYGKSYSNSEEGKIPCSKATLLNKKDRKSVKPAILNLLWREIRELSDYFIFTSEREDLITKFQDLNNWFLI
jgi:Fe-S-cluster containining protein